MAGFARRKKEDEIEKKERERSGPKGRISKDSTFFWKKESGQRKPVPGAFGPWVRKSSPPASLDIPEMAP